MLTISPDKVKYLKKLYDWIYQNRIMIKGVIGENTVYERVLTDEKAFLHRVEHSHNVFKYSKSDPKNIHNVLDYGCGWGFFIFVHSIFFESNFWGVDIREQEVLLAEKIRQDVFPDRRISFVVSPTLNINQMYDAIFFNNVLSHVKIPIQPLLEATRSLKYRGKIVIYDNNNGLSFFVRLRNKLLWEKDEKYLCKNRLNLIAKEGFDGTEAKSISRKTYGLDAQDLQLLLRTSSLDEIKSYVSARNLSLPSQLFDPPIVNERIIHPKYYKKLLEEMGYEEVEYKASSYNHYYFCEHFNLFGLSIFLFPAFIMRATRRRLFL